MSRGCGTDPDQFGSELGPRGLAIDDAGNLYVCDYGNQQIKVFSTSGTFVDSFSSGYSSDIDYANGYLYFTRPGGHVCKYSVSEDSLLWCDTFPSPNWLLNGICLDSNGNIHACHGDDGKVYKLDPSSGDTIKTYPLKGVVKLLLTTMDTSILRLDQVQ